MHSELGYAHLMGMIFSEFESSAWDAVCALDRGVAERISYGSHETQFIEYWRPECGNATAPVVVLVHGGCWSDEYDIAHIRPMATVLANEGYAVWAPEYRRLGHEEGGWPGTFEDVARAIDLLADFDDPRLGDRKVVFVGHSAGGHLALWASGRSRLRPGQALYKEKPFLPLGAIGLAAITDLLTHASEANGCREEVLGIIGADEPERSERCAQASPVALGSDVPVTLLHGDSDSLVSSSQARMMPGAETIILEGTGHFDLIHPGTAAFACLLKTLERKVQRC